MRVQDLGSNYKVIVPRIEVNQFADTWPCSGLRGRTLTFTFSKSNGDIVDITGDKGNGVDESAVSALMDDAQAFGAKEVGAPCSTFRNV